jgi:hypothetical protein
MRAVFKDSALEDAITKRGFVVISQFASHALVESLLMAYEDYQIPDSRQFTISNWSTDLAKRSATYHAIKQLLEKPANTLLDQYEAVMGVFTIKMPGAGSDMLLHQDWSLVDESKYRSVSIWVALCDMDANNGNLMLAEKSHLYCGFPRGMNVPVPFESLRHEFQKYLTAVPLTKGDAIVFDHRVIHASPENLTSSPRLAAVLALIPQEADLIHYYKYPGREDLLEILRLDKGAFHLLDFFDIPNKPQYEEFLCQTRASFRQLQHSDISAGVFQ